MDTGYAGFALRLRLNLVVVAQNGLRGLHASRGTVKNAFAGVCLFNGIFLVQEGAHGFVDFFQKRQLTVGRNLIVEPLELVKAGSPLLVANSHSKIPDKLLGIGVDLRHDFLAEV